MATYELLSMAASIPFLLVGMIVVIWAAQRLIDLPREGWLVIVGTATLMFGAFGLPNIVNFALRWGAATGAMMTWQMQIATSLLFLGVRAAGSLLLLAAVFGPQWLSSPQQPEDWGVPPSDAEVPE